MSGKIKLSKVGSIPVVKLSGEFTTQKTPELSKKMQTLTTEGHKVIAIDMSEAAYLDSYCLGVFVYSWKMLREGGCELVFLSPSDFVRDLLDETKLSQVIKVVENLDRFE